MRRLGYAGRLFREVVGLARARKVYWIIPLVILLAVASLLIVAGQSSAPVLYTLF